MVPVDAHHIVFDREAFSSEVSVEYYDDASEFTHEELLETEDFYRLIYRDLGEPMDSRLPDVVWNFGLVVYFPREKRFEIL